MTSPDTLFLIELLVVLLGIAGIVAIVARPLRLPPTVLLVAVGLVIGALAGPLGLQGRLQVTPELVLLVLLPGLVFEAAYRLRLSDLRRWSSALLLLAVPGVLLSAAVVAVVLNLATGLRADLAFLVGGDGLRHRSGSRRRHVQATARSSRSLATLVDGESLLNDGTGLVLFAIAVRAVSEPVGPRGCRSHRSSGAVGGERRPSALVAGAPCGPAGRRRPTITSSSFTISVVLAYGTYLIADELHVSGVIATVTAAVVFGNFGPGRALAETGADAIDTVWEFLAYLLTAVVFLLVGLAIPAGTPVGVTGADRVGHRGDARGSGADRVRAGRRRVPQRHHCRGSAGAMPGPWLHVLFWAGLRGCRRRRDGARAADRHARSVHCCRTSRSGSCCSRCSCRPPRSRGSCERARPTAVP